LAVAQTAIFAFYLAASDV